MPFRSVVGVVMARTMGFSVSSIQNPNAHFLVSFLSKPIGRNCCLCFILLYRIHLQLNQLHLYCFLIGQA
jgi:hypothetical protein